MSKVVKALKAVASSANNGLLDGDGYALNATLNNSESSGQLSVTRHPASEAVAAPDPVYYDIARKEYLVPDARGRWIANNEAQFKRRCKIRGVSTRAGDGVFHSPYDTYVTSLQHEKGVDFVGPLAGYPAGLHEYENRRLLVTSGPNLPVPAPGEWPILGRLLENILGDPEHDQLTYWHGWVRITFEALRAQRHKPGQAVVFVGPAEGGKTLLQELITVILGGREAKPYRYMTGKAGFNGEMLGAEHLRIGDENPHTNIQARREFGAQIKNIAVEGTQRIEAKYCEAMNLRPFWRLTISLNDEPENLLVLPPLDEHTLDKLMLFKARKLPMPMPTATPEQRAALTGELPHYLHWLLHEWTMPEALVSQRYGVTHFHHPEIIEGVEGFEPHRELRALIDAELFSDPTADAWTGTADELELWLTGDSRSHSRPARKLLEGRGSCGRYLGRLSREANGGVKETRTKHRREWTIQPPP